jgi:hypothetical protein
MNAHALVQITHVVCVGARRRRRPTRRHLDVMVLRERRDGSAAQRAAIEEETGRVLTSYCIAILHVALLHMDPARRCAGDGPPWTHAVGN